MEERRAHSALWKFTSPAFATSAEGTLRARSPHPLRAAHGCANAAAQVMHMDVRMARGACDAQGCANAVGAGMRRSGGCAGAAMRGSGLPPQGEGLFSPSPFGPLRFINPY